MTLSLMMENDEEQINKLAVLTGLQTWCLKLAPYTSKALSPSPSPRGIAKLFGLTTELARIRGFRWHCSVEITSDPNVGLQSQSDFCYAMWMDFDAFFSSPISYIHAELHRHSMLSDQLVSRQP